MKGTLAIDIETYSATDLKTAGVYRYVEDPEFEILLLGYSFDDEKPRVIDLTLDVFEDDYVRTFDILGQIVEALTDPQILKTAFNATFERVCLQKYFNLVLPVDQWECTMARSAMLGLPLSLETVAKVLKLTDQKDAAGKALIRYFTVPCKPSKSNGERTRNLPGDNLEKWADFIAYCRQDVATELSIRRAIDYFEIPAIEKKVWRLDQKINDSGIMLDRHFIKTAIDIDAATRDDLYAEAVELTGLDNPNSAAQLRAWLSVEMPFTGVDTLRKEDIPVLKDAAEGHVSEVEIKRVLTIRSEMSKTSSKKYAAMLSYICSDDRIRGLHQYYGANRTGRWAGRGVQPQNMYKNKLPDLDLARRITRSGDRGLLDFIFGNVPDVLSQLTRTAFIAPEGKKLLITDFSAIEARVIAWLANERWRLDVFATHGKIYEASGAQMFKVPIESVTKTSDYRAKAKIAELALGYQGGVNALLKMDAKKELKPEELPDIVNAWRNANKNICALWSEVENAALTAVGENTRVKIKGKEIYFSMVNGALRVELPSGRSLYYQRARLQDGRFNRPVLIYEGMNQTTKQWTRIDTYGGKLVENITQAIARDCLATALLRLDAAGFKIGMHVHDEIVIEALADQTAAEVDAIMCKPMDWAPDLPLGADTTESLYYRKD